MILCPNCNQENGDLSVVCITCGGFVQARVPTLDLFNTVWQVIESPRRAMKKVALAVHKNYVILLASVYGIGLSFFFMWFLRVGEAFDNLMYLLFTALILGPPMGLLHLVLVAIAAVLLGRLFRAPIRLKDLFGVAAYSTVPVILAILFVLPVEVMTFGLYLFTHNPSPFVIKPVSYVVLLGLDGLTILWSIVLFTLGVQILGNAGWWKSLLIALLALSASSAVLLAVAKRII